MIELIEKKINIDTQLNAEKHPAYLKEDSSYDKLTKTLTVREKRITGKGYRLVHDGKSVIALIDGEGITWTLNQCDEFETEDLSLEAIKKLGLIYEPVFQPLKVLHQKDASFCGRD